MAALKPAIIKDAIELIDQYRNKSAFRERFDAAIRRSVDVTYKRRPLKLYFEVLASTNPKYKDEYQKIRRLIRHDTEDLIKNTLLAVTQADLNNLSSHAEKAEKQLNSTVYSDEEIEKINTAENEAESPEQKYKAHKKRLDETTYLAETKTPLVAEEAEEKKPEEIEDLLIPGATPEYKRSYNPANEEEKTRLMTALNQPRQEALPGELVGPGGEPIRNIRPEPQITTQTLEEKKESTPPSDNQTNLSPHTVSEKTPSTTTPTIHTPTHDLTDHRRWPKIRSFFGRGAGATEKVGVSTITEGATIRTISTRAGINAGARFAAGRISAGKIATKLGIKAITRTGAGFLAKLGFSAATGLATGGLGFVVGLAVIAVTTFGKQIKQLGWLMVKITIGLVAFMFFMFFSNWGMKMNSLLPPYDVSYAEPVPSVTPSISITPTPTGTVTPTPTITPTLSPCDDTASIDILKQDILSQFGITMNGFDKNQLQWACTKLKSISQTNFINLTRGTVITAVEGHDSEQTGCRTLTLAKYLSEEVFNVILTHELSHIIGLCNPGEYAHLMDHAETWDNEGGVTSYSRTGCVPGTVPKTEDYAEMLTYYLNPTSNTISANCAEQQANPYLNGGYPQHKRVAEMILGRYP